jgi:peptidyl-prolyl cis-trans isomerase D
MIQFFRKLSQSWVAKILFAVLIIAFGGYGVNSMLRGKFSDDVVEAGSRSLSAADFKAQIDKEKKRWEQQPGNPQLSPDDFVKSGLAGQMAQELATQQGFAAWMAKIGLKPSDQVIAQALKQQQIFFNPVTGAFDKDRYLGFLAQNNYTEASFTTLLNDDIAAQHYFLAVRDGIQTPRVYGAVMALTFLQSRDASWFVIEPKNITMPDKPTDADLKTFMAQHSEQFTRQETRSATAVMFLPGVVAKTLQVDEAEVKKTYDFRKDSLSTPETRTFVVIAAKSQQAAAAASSQLKAGGDPSVVARSVGAQAVSFDGKPKAAVPDPAVANQAFTMQTGDVSAPVKGALGWAVVKMGAITPGHAVSYEEAKPKLEEELKEKEASAKVEDLVEQYQNLRNKGVSMLDAAKQLNLPVQNFPPFTKEGVGPNGQPYMVNGQPFNPPKALLTTLYSLPKGGESDVEDAGNNAYFAIHVNDVTPKAMVPIDDTTRPALTQAYMRQEVLLRLKAAADAAAQKVRRGQSLADVAKSLGATVQTSAGLQAPKSEQEPDAHLRASVFETALHDAFVSTGQTGLIVGQVTAVHGPATVIAAQETEKIRPQIDGMLFQGLVTQTQTAARDKMKVKVDQDLMNQVLGVAPPTAPKK